MSVSGHAILAGVVGDPVAHSLSPRLHGHWLRHYGIDGIYVPLKIAREHFAEGLRGLRLANCAGVNVTVPHKEAAYALAERLDRAALAAGAVNLLVLRDGRIEGRNSDAEGLCASLAEGLGPDALRGREVGLLGAGGAARAAVLAADRLGAAKIHVFARRRERAEAVARHMAGYVDAKLEIQAWESWPAVASGLALLLNATSAGLNGSPAPDIAVNRLPQDAAVCDLVYHPLQTQLLKAARMSGLKTVDGLGMLMHQAVPAFACFYGLTPRVTPELRAELEQALAHGR